ncbi:helix-hairpin-helix domain-containing protein [Ideonella sp. 4Y16]|uniref:Helix-hairpin-helix domain-containing protein n=1 Tax=Ideonella alba TaxID=2824118 RepID=A0A941BDC0_9BURK|nr:helix-hairpin-helix domain-containing protein [Ideonella alba]MBQ0932850.1 helix-hairpin-helix domain-containing protein [Ideonella alba]MBQ0945938.1 helix-hairpin-helix domain-containing protein [Ideonella alba]
MNRQRRHWLAWCLSAPVALQAADTRLEVNQANQAELEMLPGVGPALSEAILAERRRGGPFKDWRALQRRVKGLGPATARRLSQAGLRVNGAAV